MPEPQWVQSISSGTVCDWFYTFFWIYAVLAIVIVLGGVGLLGSIKMPFGLKLTMGFTYFLMFALTAVHFLFAYVVCDRSLLVETEGYAGAQVVQQLKKAAPRKL